MAINTPSAAQQLGPLWKMQLDLLAKKGQRGKDVAKVTEGIEGLVTQYQQKQKLSKVTTTLEDGTELNLWDLMKGKNATEVASAVKSWSLLKAKNEDETRLAEVEVHARDSIGNATEVAADAVDRAAQFYKVKYSGGQSKEEAGEGLSTEATKGLDDEVTKEPDKIMEKAGEGLSTEATKGLDDEVKSRSGPGAPPYLSYKRLAPLERIKV
jgi:hypothetical protein